MYPTLESVGEGLMTGALREVAQRESDNGAVIVETKDFVIRTMRLYHIDPKRCSLICQVFEKQ